MSGRVVFGRHPVEALLAARPGDIRRLVAGPGAEPALLDRARKAGVRVETAPRERLEALARSEHHQNLVAEAAPFRFVAPEALARGDSPLVLALDSVQDPHNLGALARSAECFGASGILFARDRSAPVSGVAVRASAGALERLPVAEVVNLVRALEGLKEAGLWVTGLAGEAGAEPLGRVDLTGPCVLVVGAEGEGLRPLVRRTCDRLAAIPMDGLTGSLNASVAGGVALYEASRQRKEKGLTASPRTK